MKNKDFKVGDAVYHLSNLDVKMIVVCVDEEVMDVGKIQCRWVTENMTQSYNFYEFELRKHNNEANTDKN